jgi:hypothetical protein
MAETSLLTMVFSLREIEGTRLVEMFVSVIFKCRTRKGAGSLVESWWR